MHLLYSINFFAFIIMPLFHKFSELSIIHLLLFPYIINIFHPLYLNHTFHSKSIEKPQKNAIIQNLHLNKTFKKSPSIPKIPSKNLHFPSNLQKTIISSNLPKILPKLSSLSQNRHHPHIKSNKIICLS